MASIRKEKKRFKKHQFDQTGEKIRKNLVYKGKVRYFFRDNCRDSLQFYPK